MFFSLFLFDDCPGSASGSGYVSLTNKSGSGRPNTGFIASNISGNFRKNNKISSFVSGITGHILGLTQKTYRIEYRYLRKLLQKKNVENFASVIWITGSGHQGCGSAFIWYGSSVLGWIPIRIRIQSRSRVLTNKKWTTIQNRTSST
jgi:hypothetical protein